MGFMSDAFEDGRQDVLSKVADLLTEGEGRTESYEATLVWVMKELRK